MINFIETHDIQNHEKNKNLNKSITSKKIVSVIKNLPTKKNPGLDGVAGEFHQIFKEKLTLGFPGGTVVKNPPANAGDMGSSPGLGRSYMLQSN